MKFLIALLTAATGVLHLLVGFGWLGGGTSTNWLLVLNGVGYLVLLVLYWTASGNRGMIRWILLVYTLITLVGYFVINGLNFATLPIIIKAIELLLIILLFLDRGSDRVAVQPAPATRMAAPTTTTTPYMGTRTMTTPETDVAVTGMAASAAAGTSTVATGAAAAAAAAAATMDDKVDYTVDRTLAASGEVGNVVEEGMEEVGYATTDMGERVGTVVDTVDAEAAGAYDAVADTAGDVADTMGDAVDTLGDKAAGAYDAVADTAGAVADTVGDAVDTLGDKASDAWDATGEAVEGGMAAAGAAVGAVVGGDTYETTDIMAQDAAALDAADLAAEPTAEQLRGELEEYLRSFGPGSEFRKEIEYIEGIGAVYGQKLRAVGISTVFDLIVNGATRRGRKHIADQSGIAPSSILTWVNHVDLFRIKGVAQEYADLLEQSGVDTVVELAQRNPANLHKRMVDINEQRKLVRRLPHASEVQSWVQQAKDLRRVVHY